MTENSVYFVRKGKGKKILMLHGWKGNSTNWLKNIDNLSRNFECVALDLPGFGRSNLPETAWDLCKYSEFLNWFVSELGWKRFVIIGKSFGGRVAIKYTSLYPEKVTNLILVSSAGIEQKIMSTRIKIMLANIGKRLVRMIPLIDFERVREWFYFIIGAELENNDLKMEIKKLVTRENLSNTLETINNPTLIIWGEKDNILSKENAYRMRKLINNSILHIIPGGTHNVHEEMEKEFNKIVFDYLSVGIRSPETNLDL